MKNDYVKNLENANEEQHDKIVQLEKTLESYANVDFIILPNCEYKVTNKISCISLAISFRGISNSVIIGTLKQSMRNKNTWEYEEPYGDSATPSIHLLDNQPIEYYVKYLLDASRIPFVKYRIRSI